MSAAHSIVQKHAAAGSEHRKATDSIAKPSASTSAAGSDNKSKARHAASRHADRAWHITAHNAPPVYPGLQVLQSLRAAPVNSLPPDPVFTMYFGEVQPVQAFAVAKSR